MTSWVLAALLALPVSREDRGVEQALAKREQLEAIADAVAHVSLTAPRPPREWAALVLAVGYHESSYSLRIHAGHCKPLECDRGRARSSWQLHQNYHTRPVWDELWGIENTAVQVRAADGMLRRAFYTCARSGVPWLQATLSAYRGSRCGAEWPGLQVRLATARRLLKVPRPKEAT